MVLIIPISKGKEKDLDPESLKDKPEDLMYFAFMCSVDRKKLDARMEHKLPFDINFCSKVPHIIRTARSWRN